MNPRSEKISPLIRYATMDDAAMLTRLCVRTFYDAFRDACSPEDMRLYLATWFTEERIGRELSDPRATFLIAEAEAAPTGYAKLRTEGVPMSVSDPDAIELERLYVEQQYLGQGVGPALMQVCLDEARRQGHHTIYLGVWEENHRAQAFYRKWDFVKVGTHTFMMGNDAQTDWWMERKL
jgi:ribosomal protein S18 acetylase RimI-like enzyme